MSKIINIFIFLSAFSALVFPSGYTIFPLILACIGWCLLLAGRSLDLSCIEKRVIYGFILICWFYAITGILIDVNHEVHLGALELYLPFLIYPILLVLYKQFEPRFESLYIGAALGGIIAFIWAFYMVYINGESRPTLHGTPISFGNTGVLIAITCAVAYDLNRVNHIFKKSFSYLLIFGVFSGVGISFLSGSKGGWLSLLTVFTLFYWGSLLQMTRIQKIVAIVIFILSMLLIVHPSSVVNQRLLEAKNGFEHWLETGKDRDGSVGARLNMYTFGLSIADKVPFFGLGPQGVDELWIEQAASGKTDPNWAPNGMYSHEGNHLHNEFLTVYLWKGPFGLIAHLLVYLFAAVHFYRKRKSTNSIQRSAATLGLLTLICYAEFAFTDAGWYVNANRQIFLFWILTLFGVTMGRLRDSGSFDLLSKVKSQ
jgi:O-antigen ligase